MKPAIFALALALVAAPGLASAQPAPGDGPHRPTAAQQAQFAQFKQLRQQTRAAELNALSPAHKQLLANIAGQLALSAAPNFKAAAAQLDAALSPGERAAILQADQNFRTQAEALHQQMMASRPPSDDAQGGPPRPMGERQPHQRTAGQLLLGMGGGHGRF
jgi:hypothetical protein